MNIGVNIITKNLRIVIFFAVLLLRDFDGFIFVSSMYAYNLHHLVMFLIV